MASCPYCKGNVTLDRERYNTPPATSGDTREVRREVKGSFKKEVMYICPHCDVVLGFGFFIGGLLTGRP